MNAKPKPTTVTLDNNVSIELSQPIPDRPDLIVVRTSDGRRAVLGDGAKIEFTTDEAARELGVTPRKFEELRDDALISTYHDNAGNEFVTGYAIADLKHRVAAGACSLGETVRLPIQFG